jgi:signal transduction histidine kinase
MRERANAIGARLTMVSPPGGGTDLIVTVDA